jgi:DeoR/GlpR family transcriptional regulator of sugar metabolism
MKLSIRHKKILEMIAKEQECSVKHLAKSCNISEITIRRDLQALASEGKIIRTHGGGAIAERVVFEFNFLNTSQKHLDAKRRIAVEAVQLIGDASSIILGAGTTTLEIAKLLKNKENLTVITTSLPIASELQFCEHLDILLIGGFLRHNSPDLTGALTESNLESLHADIAFLGADAIDLDGGIYDESINVARMLNKMVEASSKIYAVAAHSKFGKKALSRYSHLSSWNGVIVDDKISEIDREQLIKNNVNIIIAKR